MLEIISTAVIIQQVPRLQTSSLLTSIHMKEAITYTYLNSSIIWWYDRQFIGKTQMKEHSIYTLQDVVWNSSLLHSYEWWSETWDPF